MLFYLQETGSLFSAGSTPNTVQKPRLAESLKSLVAVTSFTAKKRPG